MPSMWAVPPNLHRHVCTVARRRWGSAVRPGASPPAGPVFPAGGGIAGSPSDAPAGPVFPAGASTDMPQAAAEKSRSNTSAAPAGPVFPAGAIAADREPAARERTATASPRRAPVRRLPPMPSSPAVPILRLRSKQAWYGPHRAIRGPKATRKGPSRDQPGADTEGRSYRGGRRGGGDPPMDFEAAE